MAEGAGRGPSRWNRQHAVGQHSGKGNGRVVRALTAGKGLPWHNRALLARLPAGETCCSALHRLSQRAARWFPRETNEHRTRYPFLAGQSALGTLSGIGDQAPQNGRERDGAKTARPITRARAPIPRSRNRSPNQISSRLTLREVAGSMSNQGVIGKPRHRSGTLKGQQSQRAYIP